MLSKENKSGRVEKLKEYDMEQVKLTDAYYVNAFNKAIDYLRGLDPARLVAGFREVAKLPKKANRYGGWEDSMIQGHTLGHYLSAIAQTYKNSKDNKTLNKEFKEKIDYVIDELAECQKANDNGYLFATDETHFDIIEGKTTGPTWVPWYTMDKILMGLIDVYKYGDNEKALQVASRLGDWAYNRAKLWDDTLQTRVLNVEYGGMNDCLYELYKMTGKENHLVAAHKFDEDSLFEPISKGDNILANKHANTAIPKFVGALNRYRTLGEEEAFYLRASKSFWNMVLKEHTYVTGGNSEDEHFKPAGKLDGTRTGVNNETCNTYNMLKLSRELFKITKDVKYADYYEKTFINAIMASQNPETGMTMYFQPMETGHFKVFGSQTDHFWCCTGTGMENFTKLNDSLYYHDDQELYVNMYLSSTLNWEEKGFQLKQKAQLPDSDQAVFTIQTAQEEVIKIKFRSPAWIAEGEMVEVSLNSEILDIQAVEGYIEISRVWKAGDQVTLKFPMEVQVSRLPDNKNTVAFTYGPLVLSAGFGTDEMRTAPHGIQVLKSTKETSVKDYITIKEGSVDDWLENIKKNLVQTEGKIEFTLKNTDEDERLKFTPHYKRYKDRYGIYFTLVEIDSKEFQKKILEKKEKEKIAEATIDSVQITNDQHELQHNLQGNSSGGSFGGFMLRHANLSKSPEEGSGWFSYDMKVNPSIKNYVSIKYYSGNAGRTLNLYIDNQLLKEETIQKDDLAEFYDVYYEIPSQWIAGKDQVTIKFANRDASVVGGIFDRICILKDYAANSELER
ncbi:MAG TPA: hypothetical protein GX707_12345 [Epulopiscium sp.]|nr:hypothetical protein [Candidatus Epulonipiscium sp.]